MIDKRPRLIAGCSDAADVRTALFRAQEDRLPVAVRAGDHSVAGMSTVEDGLVVDVRPMKAVEVDPAGRGVRVGAGATWGELEAQTHPLAVWQDAADDAANVAWVRRFRGDIAPWASGGVYLNFVGDEGQERVRAAYGEEKCHRLAEVKAAYDPGNVFRGNQNIAPAGSARLADAGHVEVGNA